MIFKGFIMMLSNLNKYLIYKIIFIIYYYLLIFNNKKQRTTRIGGCFRCLQKAAFSRKFRFVFFLLLDFLFNI